MMHSKNQRISRLALVVNESKDTDLAHTRAVLKSLCPLPLTVYLPKEMQDALGSEFANVKFCEAESIYENAECVLVLGGDGSVIKAAADASLHGTPIFGINLGRIGYLTALELDALTELKCLCSGDYRIEERMMLDVQVCRDGQCVKKMLAALNDAVISNGAISHMVELEVYCDGQFFRTYRADGIIMATPTGTTAYSMSAGGPIVAPTLECICMTPVCSHSLTARPMVFSPSSVITVKNVCERENNTYLTVDGIESLKLLQGDVVTIRRSESATRLIRFDDGFVSQFNKKF